MADLKEISKRATAAYNAHDTKALAELDDPNVVFTAPGPSGRTEFRGREASREYNQNWFNAFPDARISIISEVIAGDSVAQEGIFEGTNSGTWKTGTGDMPATGKKLKGQYSLVSKFKDGLVVSSNLYFDQLDVMIQMGVVPAPAEARA
jgi:predicted ester cyclase